MDLIEMLWAEHKKLRTELDADPRWQRLEKIADLIAAYEPAKKKSKNVTWPHSQFAKELGQVQEFLGASSDKWVKVAEIATWLDLNNGSEWSVNAPSVSKLSNVLSHSDMFEAKRGYGWRNRE